MGRSCRTDVPLLQASPISITSCSTHKPVVHELRHRDHTDAFWNEVDKILPDYRERKEWLRKNSAGLDIYVGYAPYKDRKNWATRSGSLWCLCIMRKPADCEARPTR